MRGVKPERSTPDSTPKDKKCPCAPCRGKKYASEDENYYPITENGTVLVDAEQLSDMDSVWCAHCAMVL